MSSGPTLGFSESTRFKSDQNFDGTYADSAELVVAMARADSVRACFARHMYRFAASRSDKVEQPAEDAFVAAWQGLDPAMQGNLGEVLVAWVGSDSFVQRKFIP